MKEHTKRIFLDFSFLAALILKVFSAGFTYYPTLDDHIQYGCYPLYEKLSYVLFGIGTAKTRPLAALFDTAVWGSFFPHLVWALLAITLLHFFSAKLFDRTLRRFGIEITPIFYGIFLLLPLGFEGTYWISASSRLVVGLFFASLSAELLFKFLENKKWHKLLLYTLTTLCSFCFYESVTIFSGLVQVLILLLKTIKDKRPRNLWLLAVPFFALVLLLAYYKIAANMGAMGSRTTEFSLTQMGTRIDSLLSQFSYIFTAGLFRTTITGLKDGLTVLTSGGVWGICVLMLIVLVSMLCALFGKNQTAICPKMRYCIPIGLALTILPLVTHILVEDVWLTYRSILVCLPGICVMLAPLCSFLLKKKSLSTACIGLLTFVLLVGCVNELSTYKTVSEQDAKLVLSLANCLDEEVLSGEKETVLVLEEEIFYPQTSPYKDHVKSVFYTDWSLTGAVRCATKNLKIKTVTPVCSLENTDTAGKQILYMDKDFNITEEYHE